MPGSPSPSKGRSAAARGPGGSREGLLAAALLPLAALAATGGYAAALASPSAAAETRYLGLLAAAVTAVVAALAPRPAAEAGLGAVLAVTLLWVLPEGPTRGAAVGAVLVAAFVTAAWRRWAREREREEGLPLALAVPLALGGQLLLRGELLLQPLASAREVVALAGLPLAGAVAVSLLARRWGAGRAVVAAAVAVLPATGFRVVSTLALVALAAGTEVAAKDRPRWLRAAALAALLAPLAWEPRAGLLAAAAGAAVAGGVAAGAAGLGALALALVFPVRGWQETWALLAWVPLLLPTLVATRREGGWRLAAALLLAVAGARAVGGASPLAAPLALAALALPRKGRAAAVQGVWTTALVAGAALLAAYPWGRPDPLTDALALAGLGAGWAAALAVLVAAVLCGFQPRARLARLVPGGATLAAAALLAALFLALPRPGMVVLDEYAVVLDVRRPERAVELAAHRVAEVVMDSHLANAALLPEGTPVARVLLASSSGAVREHVLRAGRETGEWAARRPDVAVLPQLAAPAPFRVRFDPGGTFLAQRYRARWRLARPLEAAHLEIQRAPELPEEVSMVLMRLELRP